MSLVTGSWTVDLLLFIGTLVYLIYWYYSNTFNYFKRHGIPHICNSMLSFSEWFKKPTAPHIGCQDLYNLFPGEKFFGFYQARVPTLLLKDPDLIQRVMVTDFDHFYDRGFQGVSVGNELLAKNLFFLKGQTWRSFRSKLLPVFTSGKLKILFSQFSTIGDHLLEEIENDFVKGPIDVKSLLMNFATEVIASSAFGLDFSKDSPQTNEFISRISSIMVTGFRQKITRLLLLYAPKVTQLLGLSLYAPGASDYFLNLIKSNKEYRKQNNIKRNDYFQQLILLQESEERGESFMLSANDKDSVINQLEYAPETPHKETKLLTDEGITAQAVGFLMAGTDTVSLILSLSLYHIAKDPSIQDTIGTEIDKTLTKHGGWTYEAIKELRYLDQVLQETLRLYPNLPLNFRECTSSYQIPNTNIILEKGAIIAISVVGLHMDPNLYPNPQVFDPERFVDNNYKPNAKYMPFGDGPRICIGMRFAIVEMKVCLAKILSKYVVEVNNKTQEPFIFDPYSFSAKPVGGIWINFKKRQFK